MISSFYTMLFIVFYRILYLFSFIYNKKYRDDEWTNNITYSIMNVSSAIFTRNSRCTLLLCGMVIQMLVESALYHFLDKDDWLMMLAFAFAGVIVSKIITFLYGIILYSTYQHQKTRWTSDNDDVVMNEFLEI